VGGMDVTDPEVPVTELRASLQFFGRRYASEGWQLEELRGAMAHLARMLVARGVAVTEVANLAGVSRKTVHGWLRKAQP
jgi:Rps23 Pro-64 3,4-dihydroxylase Tpa1-like proline 4-hydroxylase